MHQHLQYARYNSNILSKQVLRVAIYTPVNTLWKQCTANEKRECKLQRVLTIYPIAPEHKSSGKLLAQSLQ